MRNFVVSLILAVAFMVIVIALLYGIMVVIVGFPGMVLAFIAMLILGGVFEYIDNKHRSAEYDEAMRKGRE